MKKVAENLVKLALAWKSHDVVREGPKDYPSETSKCRGRLSPFCKGYGVDIGFGGDPILESAIRVDQPSPYAHTGPYPVQLGGNAANLQWFRDEVLDYVYSSHLLEDFPDTESVIREWLRILKIGGRLVLFCPDEQAYRAHCLTTGQAYNSNHKHGDFSLSKVKQILQKIGGCKCLYESPLVDIYSWELVVEKTL